MRQLARIVSETHEDVPVARLEGEVDMTNATSLGERLRALLTNRSAALIVDLAPTTYLDSSGITLLFGLAQELRLRQQQLHLVVPDGSPVARVITITGLDQTAPTHPTLDEALDRAR
jgi:anti-sigma B factor antagonist